MKNLEKTILFIGNSYTYMNDLPKVLSQLAGERGYNLTVDSVTKGGATLEDFLEERNPLSEVVNLKFKENKWDYIVLQEQSQIPAIEKEREEKMYPSVRMLNNKAKQIAAKTVLFMTWGRRYGDTENGFENFESTQEALKIGYTKIAQEIDSMVSPVGLAWKRALQKDDTINLWDEDNSHPNEDGTYLAACVFYGILLNENPIGLEYTFDIPYERALFLQEVAMETVNEFC
ncbi:DUF4886 domain-containing protein [Oceanirhabdus seepicola]|uniref:DUF4886 domain-containing protein n=1 Tax=Oceanirhabdus seepicola TaxID=2828781 RepID=A0A9J6NYL2_9CLOT|nr:DUF4886 domain-containing protein [Oceanirhabdus seepicola]MCM1989355.1 hypothetical protein [Oceanirhabdus seepicola]